MTSTTPSPNSRPPLKVVPPTPKPAPLPVQNTPSDSSPQSLNAFPYRWLMMGGLVIGLGFISLVEVPHSVPGEVTIASTPKSRDVVYVQIPGTITQVLVETNEQVEKGQAVVELKSDELEKEIDSVEYQLAEAQLAVATARQKIDPLKAELGIAQVEEVVIRQKAEKLEQEFEQLMKGSSPPRIRMLEREIEGLNSEISQLEENLELHQAQMQKFQTAFVEGALSQDYWVTKQKEENDLEGRLQEKEAFANSKLEQIEAIKLEMQKELEFNLAEVDKAKARTAKAVQQIQEMTIEGENRAQLVEQLKLDLERVKAKQQDLVLRAKTSGVVITEKLDRFLNQKLNAGEAVLEVVDVQQLTANVQIAQEDKPLVKKGAEVHFYPRDPELPPYTAKVEKIDPVVKTEATGKPFVMVSIAVNNQDNRLKPGETGYAQIASEKMPIYQKALRELRKLFPRGKWQSPVGS